MEHKFSKSYRAIQRQQNKPRRRTTPVVISGGGAAPVRVNNRAGMPFITLPSYRSTIGYYERRKNRWFWPIISGGTLLFLCGLAYLLFFSPLFRLTTTRIEGAGDIPEDLIDQVIKEHTQRKKFRYLPGDNLFTIHDEQISQHLASWVDVQSAQVRKQFPNTLLVTIQERRPALLWQLGEHDYLIDDEGIVVRIAAVTGALGANWPQVFGVTQRAAGLGEHLLERVTAQALVRLVSSAEQVTASKIPTIRFQYGDEQNIILETVEGWHIYVLLADWPNALERLRLLLIQPDAPDRKQLEYIDVRYENRIFTKQRENSKKQSAPATTVVPLPKP